MAPTATARAGSGPRRAYRSPRRREQARRTRRRILDAAAAEFAARGYAATTVAAVAATADVSVPTVEQAFGTKAALLKAAIDVAVAGDDDPVPVVRRPLAVAASAAETVEEFLRGVSRAVVDVADRAAGLVQVAFEAAAGDPRLRPLADQLREQRATMAGWIVDGLRARTPLRPGVDRTHAVDVVWLLMDPAVFTRLTLDRGWSRRQFREWFADSVSRLLVEQGRVPPRR